MSLSNLKKIAVYGLLFVLSACASEKPFTGVKIGKPYEINGKTYYPSPDSSYDKIGEGSWYGPGFDGKRTASGEIFDEDDITAAHPTLPMPSLVRVTNLGNNKSAVVRINDRGPFHSNRIIDLSKGTAKMIGMKSTRPVRVQFLPQETEEYLASIIGKSPRIDMVAYNEEYNKKLKERNEMLAQQMSGVAPDSETSSMVGREIESAAPMQSVAASDLAEPAPKKSPASFLIKEARADDEVKLIGAASSVGKPATKSAEKEGNKEVKSEKQVAVEKEYTGIQYYVLAGSFSSKENADKLVASLSKIPNGKKLLSVDKVEISGRNWWRVRLGTFADKNKAKKILEMAHNAGAKEAILKAQ